jgi:hypothetical protein
MRRNTCRSYRETQSIEAPSQWTKPASSRELRRHNRGHQRSDRFTGTSAPTGLLFAPDRESARCPSQGGSPLDGRPPSRKPTHHARAGIEWKTLPTTKSNVGTPLVRDERGLRGAARLSPGWRGSLPHHRSVTTGKAPGWSVLFSQGHGPQAG